MSKFLQVVQDSVNGHLIATKTLYIICLLFSEQPINSQIGCHGLAVLDGCLNSITETPT